MCQFPVAQQTRTVKLCASFLRFQTEKLVLRVSNSEITGKNAFNGDIFEIEDNHDSSKDEKIWF